jgi:hypothetical protein
MERIVWEKPHSIVPMLAGITMTHSGVIGDVPVKLQLNAARALLPLWVMTKLTPCRCPHRRPGAFFEISSRVSRPGLAVVWQLAVTQRRRVTPEVWLEIPLQQAGKLD